jgi:hypothetical protein
MASDPPKVFISYSHDSPEHAQHVLELAERLRKDGVDARIDQYVAGTPVEGWPRWMLDRLDWAEFVLVVCTETYYRRFRGHEEPGKGKGADWEGNLVTVEMYNAKSKTTKFVPVFFELQDERFIPEPVSAHTHYLLSSENNYANLYAFVTGQAGVTPGELGSLKTMARNPVEPLRFDVPDLSTRQLPLSNLPREHQSRDRQQRITLIKWLNEIPDRMDSYLNKIWQLGYGTESLSPEELARRRGELDCMDSEIRSIVRFYTRLVQMLPDLFLQTAPRESKQGMFSEVFPAFKREAEACFSAERTLKSAIDKGFFVPVSDGSQGRVPFSLLYSSVGVSDHARIFRLAAESITDLFPIDEVEEARR